ncbi:MAG TPA: hypothetical protein G4N92_07365 [Anaerolineae bacterium]|nr:hypothetical protein [Anaerolineae bacterium]
MTEQPIQEETLSSSTSKNKGRAFILIFVILLILAGSIYGVFSLSQSDPQTTSHIRDIFIIVLALESLITGIALIILVVQMALLINLLQNEIKPILDSTKETIHTLRGTTAFISEHAIRPVINASGYLAGARKFLQVIGILHDKE